MEAFSPRSFWQQAPPLPPASSFTLPNPSSPAGFSRNPTTSKSSGASSGGRGGLLCFPGFEGDLEVSAVVPAVTVAFEGRSICQRISLQKHNSYCSLARALRKMFVDDDEDCGGAGQEKDLDLSNAIPGHLIAYEDMENDLLLVGDLNWKDFVRVAKRIRILPVKESNSLSRYWKGST